MKKTATKQKRSVRRNGHEGSDPIAELFPKQDRLIYTFWDGKKQVRSDPLVLYKRFMGVASELWKCLEVAKSPMKDAASHHTRAMELLQGIFRFEVCLDDHEVKDGMVTQGFALETFLSFMAFIADVKKNSSLFTTSAAATSPASPDSPGDAPATSNSSDSGSTASGESSSSPTPSTSAAEPPSEPSSPESNCSAA